MKMIKSIEMEILGKNKVKKERYVDVTLYKFSQAHEVLKKKQGIQKKIKRLYTIYNFFKKAHEIFFKKKGYIDK